PGTPGESDRTVRRLRVHRPTCGPQLDDRSAIAWGSLSGRAPRCPSIDRAGRTARCPSPGCTRHPALDRSWHTRWGSVEEDVGPGDPTSDKLFRQPELVGELPGFGTLDAAQNNRLLLSTGDPALSQEGKKFHNFSESRDRPAVP